MTPGGMVISTDKLGECRDVDLEADRLRDPGRAGARDRAGRGPAQDARDRGAHARPRVAARADHVPAARGGDRALGPGAPRRLPAEPRPRGDHARAGGAALPGPARPDRVRDAQRAGGLSDGDRLHAPRRLARRPGRDDRDPGAEDLRRPRPPRRRSVDRARRPARPAAGGRPGALSGPGRPDAARSPPRLSPCPRLKRHPPGSEDARGASASLRPERGGSFMGGGLRRARGAFASALLGALAACATGAPPDPPPGSATAWGFVRLVPREGVTPHAPRAASPYADPALRDVEFVDYSRPGFAVVYLEGTPSPGGTASFAIRDGALRPYLEPAHAAVGAGGTLRVANASARAHILSLPESGLVRRLEPGETIEMALADPGEQPLFLLDEPEELGRLFVAPGRYTVASEVGRFELRELPPGRLLLRAWHPRFPPISRELELASGRAERVDLELGVGTLGGSRGDE